LKTPSLLESDHLNTTIQKFVGHIRNETHNTNTHIMAGERSHWLLWQHQPLIMLI